MKCNTCKKEVSETDLFVDSNKITRKHCQKCHILKQKRYKESRLKYPERWNPGTSPTSILCKRRKEAILQGNYVCSTCKKEKPQTEFRQNANSSAIFGFEGRCRDCIKYCGKFCKIKGQYGLSKEEFLSILKEQNYCCKICKQKVETFTFQYNKVNTLCLDHCHETGKLRGFICNNCNRALGLFKDSEKILLEAYKYIVHFKSGELLEKLKIANQQPS